MDASERFTILWPVWLTAGLLQACASARRAEGPTTSVALTAGCAAACCSRAGVAAQARASRA
eukprot:858428-Pleurochrysis_carterae.AAC.4